MTPCRRDLVSGSGGWGKRTHLPRHWECVVRSQEVGTPNTILMHCQTVCRLIAHLVKPDALTLLKRQLLTSLLCCRWVLKCFQWRDSKEADAWLLSRGACRDLSLAFCCSPQGDTLPASEGAQERHPGLHPGLPEKYVLVLASRGAFPWMRCALSFAGGRPQRRIVFDEPFAREALLIALCSGASPATGVCKLYSEQRAIRVKRVVDKKRL